MTTLRETYQRRFDVALRPLAKALEEQLQGYFSSEVRIDRIGARAKSVDRFLAKSQKEEKGAPKYGEPLQQIQDQVGARVIVFYKSDVDRASAIIEKYYSAVESQDLVPESEWEFGYFGKHYVLLVPSGLLSADVDKELQPQFFELQIKTLFQHAWSEANHDLGYKPELGVITGEAKRKLAFASAQAWGADMIFDDLFKASTADFLKVN